jgi:hypothetical protein
MAQVLFSLRRMIAVVAAALVMQFIASPAQADPVTYTYTGNPFTICGYGCGPESADLPDDPDNVPATGRRTTQIRQNAHSLSP